MFTGTLRIQKRELDPLEAELHGFGDPNFGRAQTTEPSSLDSVVTSPSTPHLAHQFSVTCWWLECEQLVAETHLLLFAYQLASFGLLYPVTIPHRKL